MKKALHYLSVYRKFVATSFSVNMSFRTSFVLLIIMDILFYLSTIFTVDFLFDHITNLGPWNRDQLMFFIAFMLVIDNLHMAILSESFWVLPRQIKTGEIDFIMLKPIHSIFTIFFRYARPSSIINAVLTWSFLIYYGIQIELTSLSWVLLPILVFFSFLLLAILEILISTSMFWMQEGLGINFLRMQFQQLSRWPEYIYSSMPRRAFLIAFPILLVGSGPIHFLIDHEKWPFLIGILISILVFSLILLKVWKMALLRYESASS